MTDMAREADNASEVLDRRLFLINRNSKRWRDAPKAYGPHKSLFSRWKRRSEEGIFARVLLALADRGCEIGTLMIDVTLLKTYRTASNLELKKGARPPDRGPQLG